MDIFVRSTEANSKRVFADLQAFGAPLAAHGVLSEHFAKEGDAYRFGIVPLKIETVTKISGISFDEALNGSRTFEVDDLQIPFIGRAALIENKKAAGRHKDLAEVEELERLQDDE